MDKKTQKILIIAGIGVVAYMWWKKSQETSSFSNATAGGRYGRVGGDCGQRVCRSCGVTTSMVSDGAGGCKCPDYVTDKCNGGEVM